MEKAKKFGSRINSVLMRTYLKNPQARQRNLVVSGFPKSGTTWVTQLLSNSIGMEYVRNKISFRFKGAALHTHSIDFLGSNNIVYVVRDPREVVCSAFRAQKGIDKCKISSDFAIYSLTSYPGCRKPWVTHVEMAIANNWKIVRFEDLKLDPLSVVNDVVEDMGFKIPESEIGRSIDKFDFGKLKSQSKSDKFLNVSSLSSWEDLLDKSAEDAIFDLTKNTVKRLNKKFSHNPYFFGN